MNKGLCVLGLGVLAGCGVAPAVTSLSVEVEEPFSVCEIVHWDDGATDAWGVYGATNLPRGTVFMYEIEVDGVRQEIPLIAKAGSIRVNGVLYGHKDGYIDDGTNTNFGLTTADMPSFKSGHGVVNAKVTLNGEMVCESP